MIWPPHLGLWGLALQGMTGRGASPDPISCCVTLAKSPSLSESQCAMFLTTVLYALT